MKTMCSSVPTHNPSVKGTSCGKPQAAPYVERYAARAARWTRPHMVLPVANSHQLSFFYAWRAL